MIEELRKSIAGEEFDYQALINVLKDYTYPRDKITELLRRRVIIRVKKGIYIFGEKYQRQRYSREILANMIYGPSYLSLDYALNYYGLIPERVEVMTSLTCGRSKRFSTPVGNFTYHATPMKAYPIGIDQIDIDERRFFLMATPEKALADKVYHTRGIGLRNTVAMREYLLNNLRIDSGEIEKLNAETIAAIADRYGSRKVMILSDLIRSYDGKATEL